tara:strand:+ start:311 stop:499 length:189 start_codon:yes stop_codon:yes gene_type:complete
MTGGSLAVKYGREYGACVKRGEKEALGAVGKSSSIWLNERLVKGLGVNGWKGSSLPGEKLSP